MRRKDEIPLHPKYGLNPTIPVCMYCGKEKNEIALLVMKYAKQAPMRMVIDQEPCESCLKIMEKAFMLIEVKDGEFEKKNPYRTGYIVGISLERVQEIFPNKFESHHRCCFIEEHVLKAVLGDLYGKEIE